MLLHLIKKDFLIVKKYVLLVTAAAILIPLFMLMRIPDHAGRFGFVMSAFIAVFMLLNQISLVEFNAPKVPSLLLSSPYSRTAFVLSKYGFFLIIFVFCCIIFRLESFLIPQLGALDMAIPAVTFFVLSFFWSIYLPLQYKFGYEKTKVFFFLFIGGSPFALSYLLQMDMPSFLQALLSVSPMLLSTAAITWGIGVLAVSAAISVLIYRKTDLA